MADFRNYLCWAPDKASAVISTEAVNPSAAVFLATHAPLKIRRSLINGRSLVPTDATVEEREVLRDFLETKANTGTLLMPIVGDSGSGKSHLVRWVRENIQAGDRRRVIYLEKSETSLKGVVEQLLEGVESETLNQLRRDVHTFSEGVDEAGLSRRLVNALNEVLAQTDRESVPSRRARILAGPRGLAALLQDPYVQEHLLAEGRYIPQYAAQLLSSREADQSERPPGFTTEDLPLDIMNVRKASDIAQKLLGQLHSTEGLPQDAVTMLNEHMEAAVKRASNIGTGRLVKAMLDVREAYAKENKEIILLIEDFALIQGVQRELLEALTEAAHREGRQRYASMRTLMAVTTGYFKDLPETVMSRVSASTTGYVYDLDQVFDGKDSGVEEIASFAGRYLNAARVGREELEKGAGRSVPNACETCQFKVDCHEAFGQTSEGYGLYPYNRSALLRMVHSVAPVGRPWAFIPRAFLGNIIRPVLVYSAHEIEEGSFPTARFRERFATAEVDMPLSNAVVTYVDEHDPIAPERHKLMLEFWADAPSDPGAINPGIRDAFGLHTFDKSTLPEDPGGGAVVTPIQTPKADPGEIPASLKRRLHSLEEWASRGKTLDGALARELRTLVVESVYRRYPWAAPISKELSKSEVDKAWPAKATSVSIAGTTENIVGADRAPIRFDRTATNSLFFQSLLLVSAKVPGARSEATWRLARLAEHHARDLASSLERYFEAGDADLVLGLRAALIGAALAGHAWPGMSDVDLMDAAFDDGSAWNRGDLDTRVAPWRQLLTKHLSERQNLVMALRNRFGISQGSTGAVRMIDATRALPLVLEASKSWRWEPEGTIPKWIGSAMTGFSNLEGIVDQQVEQFESMMIDIRSRIRPGAAKETIAAVRTSLEAADSVGLSPNSAERDRILALAALAEKADWRVIGAAYRNLEALRAAPESERYESAVVATAQDHGAGPQHIRDFLVASDSWLTGALLEAGERTDSMGDSVTDEVQALLREWAELCKVEESAS